MAAVNTLFRGKATEEKEERTNKRASERENDREKQRVYSEPKTFSLSQVASRFSSRRARIRSSQLLSISTRRVRSRYCSGYQSLSLHLLCPYDSIAARLFITASAGYITEARPKVSLLPARDALPSRQLSSEHATLGSVVS